MAGKGSRATIVLEPASPNPFNPATTIRYEILSASQVSLRVYSASGSLVQTLVESRLHEPGRYAVQWNGLNESGRNVAAGFYMYGIEGGQDRHVGRMVLLK